MVFTVKQPEFDGLTVVNGGYWLFTVGMDGDVRLLYPTSLCRVFVPSAGWSHGLLSQKGFVEKLVQRIVDNIEINVADIHIR